MISRTSMKNQMKGNKMPIKNKKKPQPKMLKDVMNKKFKQEARMRNIKKCKRVVIQLKRN